MMVPFVLFAVLGVAAPWLGAVGTTRYVDDNTCPSVGAGTLASPYCKIQDAICVSVSSDTVSVAPGTYSEAIRMRPGVSLISQGGPAVTTINAANQPCTDNTFCAKRTGTGCSVVTFASGHTTATRLEGFTITGGAGLTQTNWVAGGGVYLFSSGTVVNNVITNNILAGPRREYRGAGVYVALGQPVISGNTITGNRAIPGPGATGAVTYGYGGGIWVGFDSGPIITENIIQGNHGGDPNVAYSLGGGGGIVVWPGEITYPGAVIDRNLITGNFADSLGGGISLLSQLNSATLTVVTNNVIVGNRSDKNGGGVYTYFNKSSTINNTITGNWAFLGGGIYSGQSDATLPVKITNNIIEGNHLFQFGTGGGIYSLDLSTTFDPNIAFNDLWGNDRNQVAGELTAGGVIGMNGNFSSDPRYVNRTTGDFRLDPNSPAIDSATTSGAPTVDRNSIPRGFDGNGTLNNPSVGDVDVGAHEFIGSCLPAPEICDNLDNDCNTQIDDGLGSTSCGTGACQRTVQNCVGGVTQNCVPGSPSAEICDGLDNNCDGLTDEGFGSSTCGIGQCQRIVQNCVGGVTQTCTPGAPQAEICDGVDNNCDSVVDDGLGSSTCGVGQCQVTVQNCAGGFPQTCTPGAPTAEVCDGLDNNCNSVVDDGLGSSTCGVGQCQVTVQNCVAGSTQTCTPGAPTAEVCDGLDNNCDALVDEGFPDSDGDLVADCLDPDDDNDGVVDTGDCAPLDAGSWGSPSEVTNLELDGVSPTQMVWDPQTIGTATHYEVVSGLLSRLISTRGFSEGFCASATVPGGMWNDGRPSPPVSDGWYYLVRSANACGSGTLGSVLADGAGSGDACQTGVVDTDNDGSPSSLDCNDNDPSVSPLQVEVCDGIDNNCVLGIDEGNPGGGGSCGVSTGECEPGVVMCASGSLVCSGSVGPAPETCDGLDNNCDAFIDEGFADTDSDTISDCIDPDDDNDGALDAGDCAPLDAGAYAVPAEVEDVDVTVGQGTLITWLEQALGSATLYDVASGSLTVAGSLDFGVGICLGSTGASPAADGRGDPVPGSAWYYMVKSRNACGAGTYGTSGRDTQPACP